MGRSAVTPALLLACAGLVAACGSQAEQNGPAAPTSTSALVIAASPTTAPPAPDPEVPAAAPPSSAPAASVAPPASRAAAPLATATTRPRPRAQTETGWSPFATVGGVTLTHPAARVERVAFHQASHDGARQLDPAPTATAAVTMESRERGTSARTAADIVVDPVAQIRSPVTGRVKRAGRYVLYCKHSDDFVVVEPDGRPGWEVKILHIDGERVSPGQRVTAGQTVIAGRATQLPFESQVDELRTSDPAWPHVHVEVVDLAIPDRPTPGGGCP